MLFSAITVLPALFYTGISTGINPVLLIAALFSSVAAFLGFFFMYRAFKYGNISIIAPIVSSYPAVIVLGLCSFWVMCYLLCN